MEEINGHLIDIAMTLVGSAVLGLIGFVWRISHKVSELSKKLDHVAELNRRDTTQVQRDIDMVMSKVDKHGEWTTNRMMSIAKEMPR